MVCGGLELENVMPGTNACRQQRMMEVFRYFVVNNSFFKSSLGEFIVSNIRLYVHLLLTCRWLTSEYN